MQVPGVWIETLCKPQAYTPRQLDLAAQLADLLHRGKLVLVVAPEGQR